MSTMNKASPEELIRILASKTFTLVPSNSDAQLQIHERLLSLSPSLHSVCEKNWVEQNQNKYKFTEFNEEKDADTGYFVEVTKEMLLCFISWAYIGDYSTKAVGVSSYVEEDIRHDTVVEPDWGSYNSKKDKKKGKNFFGRVLQVEIETEEEQTIGESANIDLVDSPIDNGGPCEHHEAIDPLFLNVQIYTFAEIYLIDSLKILSKRKIIDYLKRVENASRKPTQSILDILEYAVINLPDNDPLLDWLAWYSSWKLEDLRSSTRLENILGIGSGKFAKVQLKYIGPSQRNPFGYRSDEVVEH